MASACSGRVVGKPYLTGLWKSCPSLGIRLLSIPQADLPVLVEMGFSHFRTRMIRPHNDAVMGWVAFAPMLP